MGEIITAIGTIILTYTTLSLWAETPVVYYSWETQKCVRVEYGSPGEDCNNLPEKYTTEWTK